ncbi:TPA: hypothetical protein P6G21_001743 [Staphylococcus aureus]|nr:hypothetical protein [Staphylococcus aureus]
MPLFLQPILKTKLWGGQRLSEFGYQLDNDTTGECWCVSAHPNGTSEIINGPYQGQTLDRIWSEHRELFGDFPSKDFPLLTKIVDARESLSIHVHPDNSYAYEHENGQYGKSECWYIIDAEEDAEIVIGTLAESREFCLVTVLEGEGQMIVDGEIFKLTTGTNFILTSEDLDSVFEGDFTLMISYV